MSHRYYLKVFKNEPNVLTVPDVVRLLQFGKNTVYGLIKEGRISSIKQGKKIIVLLANGVPLKHIQEWLGHSDFSTTVNIKNPYVQLKEQNSLIMYAKGRRDAKHLVASLYSKSPWGAFLDYTLIIRI